MPTRLCDSTGTPSPFFDPRDRVAFSLSNG